MGGLRPLSLAYSLRPNTQVLTYLLLFKVGVLGKSVILR